MHKALSAPLMIQWEVTPACNHNCIHCYNHWRSKEKVVSHGHYYEDTLSKSVVREIISNKVFAVNITGGEPLLVIDHLAPSLKELSANNVQIAMNSNLTLLTKERAQILKECRMKSILVSIPSGDPKVCDQITGESNSLERITQGISLAKDAGINIFANMVVSKINQGQIEETARLVSSLGVKHFAATKASDPSEGKGFSSEILGTEEFHCMQKTLEEVGKKFKVRINSLEANPPCSYGGREPLQGVQDV